MKRRKKLRVKWVRAQNQKYPRIIDLYTCTFPTQSVLVPQFLAAEKLDI